jgi:glycosyltransferase involved in cell wall biosynthesis
MNTASVDSTLNQEAARSRPIRVAVCIGTFRRPQLLRALLLALGQLRFTKVSRPKIEIVIVDNDVSGSAEGVCEISDFPWPIRYVCEWRRGIASVRNRAIAEAGDADVFVFIDDDEAPNRDWLDELLWCVARFNADVVAGPVLPAFSEDVPQWVRTGGFFDRLIFPTGATVELCSTNNVLIRKSVLEAVPGFDEQFNLTGGEDTHFFLRIRESGHKMVWSREAVVHEAISAERANIPWILRRGYQSGNSWVLCEMALGGTARVWVTRLVKALAHVVRGLASLAFSAFAGKTAVVWSLRDVCLGVGMLAGLLGHRFLPYQNSGVKPVEKTTEVTNET